MLHWRTFGQTRHSSGIGASCAVIEQAKSHYDIEVWKILNVMSELMRELKSRPYRNDVLRTIQLISKKTNLI